MQSEISIVRSIIKHITINGGHAIKMPADGIFIPKGTPDIFACLNGRMLVVEVKNGSGYKATPRQLWELDQWKKAGAITGVVESLEEFKELIQ